MKQRWQLLSISSLWQFNFPPLCSIVGHIFYRPIVQPNNPILPIWVSESRNLNIFHNILLSLVLPFLPVLILLVLWSDSIEDIEGIITRGKGGKSEIDWMNERSRSSESARVLVYRQQLHFQTLKGTTIPTRWKKTQLLVGNVNSEMEMNSSTTKEEEMWIYIQSQSAVPSAALPEIIFGKHCPEPFFKVEIELVLRFRSHLKHMCIENCSESIEIPVTPL